MPTRVGGLFSNIIESPPVNRIFRRPEPEPEPEFPTLEWGGTSNFTLPPQSQSSGGNRVIINWPTFGEDSNPEEEFQRTFNEVSRETSRVRVENPDDASQFVIVDRIDKLTMVDSGTSETVLMIFRNPAT
jgi:hypothetical protein